MSDTARTILGTLNVTTGLTASLGNLLVIAAILCYRNLQGRNNLLLAFLSITDLAVGFVIEPMVCSQVFNVVIGNDCSVAFAVTYISAMLCGASSWTLTLISYDRYLHLIKLKNYNMYMSNKKLYIMLAFCWIYPILLATLMFTQTTIDAYYGILVGSAFCNMGIIMFCYYKSWKFVHEKSKVFPEKTNTMSKEDDSHIQVKDSTKDKRDNSYRQVKRDWKLAKTFAIVIVCYILSWSPMTAFVIFLMIWQKTQFALGGFLQYLHTVYYITLWMGYTNSSLNPFIYYWRNREMREGIKKFLKRKIFRVSADSDTSVITLTTSST